MKNNNEEKMPEDNTNNVSFGEYIAHLIDLHQKASPGPWETSTTKPMTDEEKSEYFKKYVFRKKGKFKTIQGVWLPSHPETVIGEDVKHPTYALTVCQTGDGENSFHNSEFIAAARDAIPNLIGVLSRVNIDILKLKEEIDVLKKDISSLSGEDCQINGRGPCYGCIRCAKAGLYHD